MRTTGLGFSALLIAAGAILAWAVSYDADGVDLNRIGVILMLVGGGLALITLFLAAAGRRTVFERDGQTIVNGEPVVHRQREVVTDHDAY